MKPLVLDAAITVGNRESGAVPSLCAEWRSALRCSAGCGSAPRPVRKVGMGRTPTGSIDQLRGAGAGTLIQLPASKVAFAEIQFDGTNWALKRLGQLA